VNRCVDKSLSRYLVDHPELGFDTLRTLARRAEPLLDDSAVDDVVVRVRAGVDGVGAIEQLLADPEVTEVMVNGPGPVWVERSGRIEPAGPSLDDHDIALVVERILGPLGLRSDRLSPIVDARLPNGARVNVVAAPLAVDGPAVSIRRFADRTLELEAFGPPPLVEVLVELMARRACLLVVGATSSGKTTLLNSLAPHIDGHDRIITIEDTAELRFEHPHVVRLEARPANSEGVGRVSLRQLVTTALRMRPDRLVVGEVRGAEAFDLLLALTAGHQGSLATCHAADPRSGLRRLQLLASLADATLDPELIGHYVLDAVDAVVHVARDEHGNRRVGSVVAVPSGAPSLGRVELEVLWSTS
jgi:pilus assembly protein CpaF